MNSNNIGGFFELELPKITNTYHKRALPLSTGRACLNLLLTLIKPKKVFVPFYTCNVMYETIVRKKIDLEYYAINENLELEQLPILGEGEIFIYINYFGMKSKYTEKLSLKYKEKLIIDNSHHFFSKGYIHSPSFNSARKHFGVPDGAYLYADIPKDISSKIPKNESISIKHSFLRLMNKQEESYQAFLDYEKKLDDKINYMSDFSQRVLGQHDFGHIKELRMNNFIRLHKGLKNLNQLHISIGDLISPFCYPLLLKDSIDKKTLYEKGFYIPTLWDDVLQRGLPDFNFEKILTCNLLPLPIDHRYSEDEMDLMIQFLNNYV
jgi:hypothetical protein